MFFWIVFVGLLGGASYVLCFYKLLSDEKTPMKMKELSVNIVTIFNEMGIILSSLVILLADNTFMKFEN